MHTHPQDRNSFQSFGYLKHIDIYQIINKAWWGLLPFIPHPFHAYASPNKLYMYIHAGALPILSHYYRCELEVPRFSSFSGLLQLFRHLDEPDQAQLIHFARNKLIMDNYLDNLKLAYENADLC